jgi:CRP-like cAMP-binding protein
MSAPTDGFDEQDGIELVQRLPIFHGLTFDETRRLFALARVERHEGGAVLVEQDALGEALFVVKRGRVRVLRDGAPVGLLGEGELFGEMSLVDDLFTSARVEADGPVELLVLPRRPFERLVAGDAPLAVKIYRAFCRTLSDRLRRANLSLPPERRLGDGVA